MGKKRKKKKSSAKWFRPVLPVKKAQEKKIWRGECSNVPKKSKSGVGKKKVAYRAPAAQACTPPTWTINRIFSKSEILAESLLSTKKKTRVGKDLFFFFFFREKKSSSPEKKKKKKIFGRKKKREKI